MLPAREADKNHLGRKLCADDPRKTENEQKKCVLRGISNRDFTDKGAEVESEHMQAQPNDGAIDAAGDGPQHEINDPIAAPPQLVARGPRPRSEPRNGIDRSTETQADAFQFPEWP